MARRASPAPAAPGSRTGRVSGAAVRRAGWWQPWGHKERLGAALTSFSTWRRVPGLPVEMQYVGRMEGGQVDRRVDGQKDGGVGEGGRGAGKQTVGERVHSPAQPSLQAHLWLTSPSSIPLTRKTIRGDVSQPRHSSPACGARGHAASCPRNVRQAAATAEAADPSVTRCPSAAHCHLRSSPSEQLKMMRVKG